MSDEPNRLNMLSRGDDERAAVRAVFDWSYQRLPAEQARLFRLLGLHPGPELSVPAAAALADLDPTTARGLLDSLAGSHLIEPAAQRRYRFHDLLRAYAADQAHRHDPAGDRAHALHTLLSWYAHTALACDEMAFPAHVRLPLLLPAPVHPTVILNRAQALQWLDSERDNLRAALHHAACDKLGQHALHLATSLRFLASSGSWDEALDGCSCALEAARDRGDYVGEAYFLIHRGETLTEGMRRWDEAQADFNQALAVARAHGDRRLEGMALNSLGYLSCERECFEEALAYLAEAKPLLQGFARWEPIAEVNLSRAYIGLGRYREALEHGERSLTLFRSLGDPPGEPYALHQLARAWQGLGEHNKAIDLCREAITLGRTAGNLNTTVAEPLNTLAISLHHNGNTTDAAACWSEAANLFDEYGFPHQAGQVRQRLHMAQVSAGDGYQGELR